MYKSVVDCTRKTYLEEGFIGFFKGWTANWFRLGPHTLLLLVFWDQLKYYHLLYETKAKDPNTNGLNGKTNKKGPLAQQLLEEEDLIDNSYSRDN